MKKQGNCVADQDQRCQKQAEAKGWDIRGGKAEQRHPARQYSLNYARVYQMLASLCFMKKL